MNKQQTKTKINIGKKNIDDERLFKKIKFSEYIFNNFNNFNNYCFDNNIDEDLNNYAILNYKLCLNTINDSNKKYINEICIASLLITFINTKHENEVENIVNKKIFGFYDDKLILTMYYLAKNKNFQYFDNFNWQFIPKYIYELNYLGINDIYNFVNKNNIDNKISKKIFVDYIDKQVIYIKKVTNDINIFKKLYNSNMSYYDNLRNFINTKTDNYIFINDIENLFY
jgi:hypothetical protein